MEQSIKILFISHDAYRAGAQLLLLNLIKWIRNNRRDFEMALLLKDGGNLESEFSKLLPVYKWPGNNPEQTSSFKLFKTSPKNQLLNTFRKESYDLIYSNTIMNGDILEELAALNVPVILHVHELDYWIQRSGQDNIDTNRKCSSAVIAASGAVKKYLTTICEFDPEKVEVIYEYTSSKDLAIKASLKQKLGIDNDVILIGGCGAENWRKGKDLFLSVAITTLHAIEEKNIHFVWIGGQLSEELKHDLQHSGLSQRIHFIDHLPGASAYFHDINIFLMTSREDPFPVVNLEFGLRGIPVLCFSDSGGTPELLQNQPDMIIPFGDIGAMSTRLIDLLINEQEAHFLGSKLKNEIEDKFEIEIIMPKIMDCINRVKLQKANY